MARPGLWPIERVCGGGDGEGVWVGDGECATGVGDGHGGVGGLGGPGCGGGIGGAAKPMARMDIGRGCIGRRRAGLVGSVGASDGRGRVEFSIDGEELFGPRVGGGFSVTGGYVVAVLAIAGGGGYTLCSRVRCDDCVTGMDRWMDRGRFVRPGCGEGDVGGSGQSVLRPVRGVGRRGSISVAQLGSNVRVVPLGAICFARPGGLVGDGLFVVARRRGGGVHRMGVRSPTWFCQNQGRGRATLALL